VFLVYKPEGQEEQRFEFHPGRIKAAEMEAIEKRTGMPYGSEFKQQLLAGSALARRALLWTMLRRVHLSLRFEDVDFFDDELLLERDKAEIDREIGELEKFEGISDTDRAMALSILRGQQETAPDAPGKALVNGSVVATG
jgi:hypothetical protein